ncbi:MAG TPA: amidohydrolase, partial [Burkholderiaceae bacterium]|nr:amidohydrolase [Burkholderiaceae bacterium]
MTTAGPSTLPDQLVGARLPRWCLPPGWPMHGNQPAPADVRLADGRIESIAPHDAGAAASPGAWHLHGAPVLPGLVEAHTHLDKTFTLPRLGPLKPGLLAAIETMIADRLTWTEA